MPLDGSVTGGKSRIGLLTVPGGNTSLMRALWSRCICLGYIQQLYGSVSVGVLASDL
jgi:hypothetical protein